MNKKLFVYKTLLCVVKRFSRLLHQECKVEKH